MCNNNPYALQSIEARAYQPPAAFYVKHHIYWENKIFGHSFLLSLFTYLEEKFSFV